MERTQKIIMVLLLVSILFSVLSIVINLSSSSILPEFFSKQRSRIASSTNSEISFVIETDETEGGREGK